MARWSAKAVSSMHYSFEADCVCPTECLMIADRLEGHRQLLISEQTGERFEVNPCSSNGTINTPPGY